MVIFLRQNNGAGRDYDKLSLSRSQYGIVRHLRLGWLLLVVLGFILGELGRLVGDEHDENDGGDDEDGRMKEEDGSPFAGSVSIGDEQPVESRLDEQGQALGELDTGQHKVVVLPEQRTKDAMS